MPDTLTHTQARVEGDELYRDAQRNLRIEHKVREALRSGRGRTVTRRARAVLPPAH